MAEDVSYGLKMECLKLSADFFSVTKIFNSLASGVYFIVIVKVRCVKYVGMKSTIGRYSTRVKITITEI